VIAAAAALGVSACGSGDQTTAAASCLQNALNYNVSVSCSGAQQTVFEISSPVTVTCTHQSANQYVCDASDGHFYAVTYDGQRIVYQQTQ
jgi:hypothetical protein